MTRISDENFRVKWRCCKGFDAERFLVENLGETRMRVLEIEARMLIAKAM